MPSDEQCSDCRFFTPMGDRYAPEEPWGECRKYAPKLLAGSSGSSWPSVDADDWCGEYEAEIPILKAPQDPPCG